MHCLIRILLGPRSGLVRGSLDRHRAAAVTIAVRHALVVIECASSILLTRPLRLIKALGEFSSGPASINFIVNPYQKLAIPARSQFSFVRPRLDLVVVYLALFLPRESNKRNNPRGGFFGTRPARLLFDVACYTHARALAHTHAHGRFDRGRCCEITRAPTAKPCATSQLTFHESERARTSRVHFKGEKDRRLDPSTKRSPDL